MLRRAFPFLLLLACLVLAWAGARHMLLGWMSSATGRGLGTIADLVAVDVLRAAIENPRVGGPGLLSRMSRRDPLWGDTIEKVGIENFRHIYFFDLNGASIRGDGQVHPGGAGILPDAISRIGNAGLPARGARFEPYAGQDGQLAVGVWRWLPESAMGIVVERPYGIYAQPLEWLDRVFVSLLGVMLLYGLAGMAGWLEAGRAWLRARQALHCGAYRIERLLGEGAMSRVYLARHERLGRLAAVKVQKVHMQSDEIVHRFQREARLASRLNHPNIVSLFEHGQVSGGGFYYAMEYVPGMTLSQWVESDGPVAPDRVLRLLRQVASALAAMHDQCLLHRDIKPDNIMAYAAHGEADLVKLLDFGLIRHFGEAVSRDLTRNVRVLGTPAFMAPERLFDPGLVDPRSDVYGVGCVAFYLLTGRRPFEAAMEQDLAVQVRTVEAPRVGALSPNPVPPALEQLVADCLAKDRGLRPANGHALCARLDAIALALPWQAAPARAWWRDRQASVESAPVSNPALLTA